LPGWRIRSATPEDIAPVLALWEAAGGEEIVGAHAEGLSTLLETDPRALLVAESESEHVVIGSVIAAWDGWRGNLYRLVVHPDHRRHRLGTELARAGEGHLRERRAARLSAIVADDDQRALAFWTAAGYRRQPDRARFIRPAAGDAP
jgi:ribosomal protein S18 acetylase RimI-like enzyme